ncbi:hypothetical protein DFH08DRAFT_987465 [Mycena albidolilacea]|uniref:Uncharacterized protein n=1 Tax=Mycena albidolilacea TaxID=1033008 RepID=A0AAD7EXL0_9AGAR|nr:hypothetical protein DFH08DRAFT_987465 [Mycena albidolilacea]
MGTLYSASWATEHVISAALNPNLQTWIPLPLSLRAIQGDIPVPDSTRTCPKSDPSVYLTIPSGPNSTVGAFSPTPDAQTTLEFFITPVRKRRPTAVPPTPQRALTIPSICRTAPALVDRVPPSPSFAALLDFDTNYATPRRPSTSPIRDATPPALTSLERRSHLCSARVVCATCRTPGTNFPACPHCSAAWCSLTCGLPNGARHVCPAAATPKPSPSRPGTGISKSPLVLTPMPITIALPLVRTRPPNREADVQ